LNNLPVNRVLIGVIFLTDILQKNNQTGFVYCTRVFSFLTGLIFEHFIFQFSLQLRKKKLFIVEEANLPEMSADVASEELFQPH